MSPKSKWGLMKLLYKEIKLLPKFPIMSHSVNWDVSPPCQRHHLFFFGNPLLNLHTAKPPFVFREIPLKTLISQWTPIVLKFFILNPVDILKVAKLLVKISQFNLLVITQKNNFLINFFFLWIFQILVYFLCKNCKRSLWKRSLLLSFPATPSKNGEPVKFAPFFKNLVEG